MFKPILLTDVQHTSRTELKYITSFIVFQVIFGQYKCLSF